jgi:hypothetical protein
MSSITSKSASLANDEYDKITKDPNIKSLLTMDTLLVKCGITNPCDFTRSRASLSAGVLDYDLALAHALRQTGNSTDKIRELTGYTLEDTASVSTASSKQTNVTAIANAIVQAYPSYARRIDEKKLRLFFRRYIASHSTKVFKRTLETIFSRKINDTGLDDFIEVLTDHYFYIFLLLLSFLNASHLYQVSPHHEYFALCKKLSISRSKMEKVLSSDGWPYIFQLLLTLSLPTYFGFSGEVKTRADQKRCISGPSDQTQYLLIYVHDYQPKDLLLKIAQTRKTIANIARSKHPKRPPLWRVKRWLSIPGADREFTQNDEIKSYNSKSKLINCINFYQKFTSDTTNKLSVMINPCLPPLSITGFIPLTSTNFRHLATNAGIEIPNWINSLKLGHDSPYALNDILFFGACLPTLEFKPAKGQHHAIHSTINWTFSCHTRMTSKLTHNVTPEPESFLSPPDCHCTSLCCFITDGNTSLGSLDYSSLMNTFSSAIHSDLYITMTTSTRHYTPCTY